MNSQQTSTWIDFPPNSSTLRLQLKCYSGVNGKSSVARKAAVLPTIISRLLDSSSSRFRVDGCQPSSTRGATVATKATRDPEVWNSELDAILREGYARGWEGAREAIDRIQKLRSSRT